MTEGSRKPAFYRRLSKTAKREYDRSDARRSIPVAPEAALGVWSDAVVAALESGKPAGVQRAAQALVDGLTANFDRRLRDHRLDSPKIKVLRTRPRQASSELHGLYTAEEGERAEIRVWMFTAAEKRIVRPRTFLRVLLHEVCHHLDFEVFDLPSSFHSGGFHARESSLLRALEANGATIPGARRPKPETPPRGVALPAAPEAKATGETPKANSRGQFELFPSS